MTCFSDCHTAGHEFNIFAADACGGLTRLVVRLYVRQQSQPEQRMSLFFPFCLLIFLKYRSLALIQSRGFIRANVGSRIDIFMSANMDSTPAIAKSPYNSSQVAREIASFYPRSLTSSPVVRNVPENFSYSSLRVVSP